MAVCRTGKMPMFLQHAGVAELADALDSKSSGRKAVWVRAPPPAVLFIGRWEFGVERWAFAVLQKKSRDAPAFAQGYGAAGDFARHDNSRKVVWVRAPPPAGYQELSCVRNSELHDFRSGVKENACGEPSIWHLNAVWKREGQNVHS
jgi:hypothetical protein